MKRILSTAILSIIFVISSFGQTLTKPEFLKAGDKVAIISPSFAIYDTTTLNRACDAIRGFGLEPVLGNHVWIEQPTDKKGGRRDFYAGTLEERLDDIMWAYSNPEIKAIICSRGGYGAIQLLDRIPLSLYSMNPKWIVGYSDITNLLAASTMSGVMSIHGNMCSAFGDKKGFDEYSEAVLKLLMGKVPEYDVPASIYNIPGHAEGILVGGNAITYEVLIGTKYDFTQNEGIILFIEEVGETMHAIDRFLNTLKIQGRLQNVKGIIIGNITKTGNDMYYTDVFEMIDKFTSKLGIPVSFGLECGHGGKNWPLVIGAPVSLDVNSEGSRIRFSL